MIASQVLILLLPAIAAGQGSAVLSDRSAILRAVVDAHDENRAKFPFGSVRLEYWDGYAAGVDEAVKGNLKDAYSGSGEYLFNGTDALCSKLFPKEALAATTQSLGAGQLSSRLDSFRLLTNGKLTFTERIAYAGKGGISLGHIITSGPNDFFKFVEFPLSLGFPEDQRQDLGYWARIVLNGRPKFGIAAIEERAMMDGVPTVRIALTLPNGVRTYWVDIERGAIPLRIEDEVNGGNHFYWSCGDIRHVDGRGWLPFTMTTLREGGRTRRLIIKEASFDSPPPAAAFRIELDQPTKVANTAEGRSYTERRHIDLNDLPKPTSRESIPLGRGPVAGPPSSFPDRRSPRPPYYTMAALAVVIAVVVVLWRRGRSR